MLPSPKQSPSPKRKRTGIERCTVEEGLERSTVASYEAHLKFHIVPYLGRLLLTKLNIPTVRRWQAQLRSEGRSENLIRRVTVDLGAILSVAQDDGAVARNVVYEMNSRTRSRKKKQTEKRLRHRFEYGVDIPTHDEINRMLEHCKPLYRPMMITLIFTGMRSSEIRALSWRTVDFENHIIKVARRVDRYGQVGSTKSYDGYRTIPVPAIVINALREWKLRCPKGRLGLVFPNGEGNLENHGNLIKRFLKPMQVAAGLVVEERKMTREKVDEGTERERWAVKPATDEYGLPITEVRAKYTGLHALRHFFASWCINRESAGGLGLTPKEVQERMGHSSIQVTVDTYGHLFPNKDETESLTNASHKLLPSLRAT